ncbi:MAG: glycosyltransferase family 39 protein [Bacteroidota bacterium]
MKSSDVWKFILAALFFIGLYTAIAYLQNNFAFNNFDYGKTNGFFMKWIADPEFQSFIWKLLLLLPALVLLAFAFVQTSIRISFPEKINEKIVVGTVMVIATIILVLSTQFVFHETQVTDDENTYDFQAQTLLAGRIVNPPPPVIKSFKNVFIINDGYCWVGKYTLGHPLIIAFGMLLGDRYIGIIAVSVLTLLLIYLIALELYGNKNFALLTLCLGAVSPFFYLVSSSRLSHTTSTFFLSLFMYLFLRVRRIDDDKVKMLLSLLAGISLGYAFNTRTLSALGFALPFTVIVVKDAVKFSKKTVGIIFGMGMGFFVMFALTLWYNARVTGNPLQFPFHYYSPFETVGFGTYGHTPLLGVKNLLIALYRLNISLLGIPISLLFAFVLFITSKDRRDYFLFAILGSFAALYLFYYSPGVSDLGPVYYYEMIIPLLLLSARGIKFSLEFISQYSAHGKTIVATFLVVLCIAAWVTYVPEKIIHISRLTNQIREPYELVKASNVHHAVVMIERLPYKGWVFGYKNTSPLLTDDVVYCLLTNKESNSAIAKYFYDREIYVLHYDEALNKSSLSLVNRSTL